MNEVLFSDGTCPLANGDMCPIYKRRLYKATGRRLEHTDEQIEAIIAHRTSSEQTKTQEEFCEENGFKSRTYRNIVNGHIKNAYDRARIDRIAKPYGLKINWDTD